MNRIGKYEIQAQIGKGGFGEVFRAFDSSVGRPVALKILIAGGDPELLTRFRNEAAAAGNLQHRNIVTIYDFGEENGLPFLVMELLDGENLDRLMRRRALTLFEKLRIMLQVAEGLHFAHQRGVVHRDIKPSNVMVLPDGTAKIMDFGIARLARESGARLTRRGDMLGTIMYMAPEQFQGEDADALSDIFSFGIILCELLTGKHPFPASDPAAHFYQVTIAERAPLREAAPDCPEALERIVAKLLSKDRSARYQSLEDMVVDSQPILMELKRERVVSLLSHAQAEFTKKDFEAAEPLLREALDLDPYNSEARGLRESVRTKLQVVTAGTRPQVPAPPVPQAPAVTHQAATTAGGLDQGPTAFFKATVFSKTSFFKEDNVRYEKIQETLQFYREHLSREYQALSRQAQVTYYLWVGCVFFGFATLLAGVVMLIMGNVSRGVLTTVSTVLVFFIQRVFQQREDHYRSLAAAKHEHLEYGNQWLLVIQSIDSIEDNKERLRRQARLCDVLTRKLQKAAAAGS